MVDLAALYRDTGDIPWILGLSGGKDSTALTMHLLGNDGAITPSNPQSKASLHHMREHPRRGPSSHRPRSQVH